MSTFFSHLKLTAINRTLRSHHISQRKNSKQGDRKQRAPVSHLRTHFLSANASFTLCLHTSPTRVIQIPALALKWEIPHSTSVRISPGLVWKAVKHLNPLEWREGQVPLSPPPGALFPLPGPHPPHTCPALSLLQQPVIAQGALDEERLLKRPQIPQQWVWMAVCVWHKNQAPLSSVAAAAASVEHGSKANTGASGSHLAPQSPGRGRYR